MGMLLIKILIHFKFGFAFQIGTFEALTSLIFRFVLEGIAAGIFIYVASIEMLSTEIPHFPSKSGFIKALTVVIGAAIFFYINLLLT
jgi:hypothetical protein